MSSVIYINGNAQPPWERFQEVKDDFGTVWKAKMGEIKVPHWARISGTYDLEGKESSITPWHLNWQYLLLNKCKMNIEVCKLDSNTGKLRRADAICADRKVVVEVQYSSISSEEIRERTLFWNNLNYQVLWIFSYPKIAAQHKNVLRKRKDIPRETVPPWEMEVPFYKYEAIPMKDLMGWQRLSMRYSSIPNYIASEIASKNNNEVFLETEDSSSLHRVIDYYYLSKAKAYKHSVRFQKYTKERFIEILTKSPS